MFKNRNFKNLIFDNSTVNLLFLLFTLVWMKTHILAVSTRIKENMMLRALIWWNICARRAWISDLSAHLLSALNPCQRAIKLDLSHVSRNLGVLGVTLGNTAILRFFRGFLYKEYCVISTFFSGLILSVYFNFLFYILNSHVLTSFKPCKFKLNFNDCI